MITEYKRFSEVYDLHDFTTNEMDKLLTAHPDCRIISIQMLPTVKQLLVFFEKPIHNFLTLN